MKVTLKRLNMKFYDPTFPLLVIYPKEMKIYFQPMFTQIFIAALFTTARKWKQPKCPLIDEWINKMWYNQTMKYYLATKSNEYWHMLQHEWTLKTLC